MKKKVLFIIYSFSAGGGAESLLTTIVNNLNPNKYEIGIMEIVHYGVKKEPVNENIKIYPYYVRFEDPERKAKMYYVFHEWGKIIEAYIPKDYDLYVSFNYLRSSFLLPPGKKTIAWIHGGMQTLAQEDKQEERMLQDKAFYKADRIVAISDLTAEYIRQLFPAHSDKIKIIYNGIDIEKIQGRAKEHTSVNLKHPALLAVGRLDENKNPLRLLEIFTQVHNQNPETHLYYLGYGILEEAVTKAAEENGLSEYVHLLGYCENPFPIMSQCDMICMFSISEGFPMVLLEGVALDKPFVSSVIGGARTLANEQTCGKVVKTNEDAVKNILKLLQIDQDKIKKECKKSIKRFALKSYIQQIETLFEQVLNGDSNVVNDFR